MESLHYRFGCHVIVWLGAKKADYNVSLSLRELCILRRNLGEDMGGCGRLSGRN